MSFVRRSRKGKIHTVRQRIAGQHKKLSRGLAKANQGVIGGVNQVHRGLQLGLAKGHSAIQSGLKGVEKFTGDFSMANYYQYEPPVAMFSMAEIEKYNKYGDGDYAYFETRALPGKGGTSAGTNKARWQRTSASARGTFRSVRQGIGSAAKGFAGSAGSVAGKPLDWTGRRMGEAAYKVGQMGGDNVIGKAGKGAYEMISKNPRLAGGLALGAAAATAAAGVGGAMFLRRRRTKKGKVVVEQVRR